MSPVWPAGLAKKSLEVANHTDAMLGYWDKNLICRYANRAYQKWFGISPEEMIDRITMKELLGPLFEKNLPYIRAALLGHQQVFEREILLPSGETKTSIATYYPHEKKGMVEGFFVHVADVTMLKNKQLNAGVSAKIPGSLPGSLPGVEQQLPGQIAETLRQQIFGKFPGIQALAKKHYVSATKLKTDFKAKYKVTPFVFYRSLQMELAEKYLADKLYTSKQLAMLFNFSSTANFTDCYKAYQWRKCNIAG